MGPERALAFPIGNRAQSIFSEGGADGGTRTRTGIPPTDFHTDYGFHRRRIGRRLWSGLSLHHSRFATLDAARLVSTPSGLSPSLARDWHRTVTDH